MHSGVGLFPTKGIKDQQEKTQNKTTNTTKTKQVGTILYYLLHSKKQKVQYVQWMYTTNWISSEFTV